MDYYQLLISFFVTKSLHSPPPAFFYFFLYFYLFVSWMEHLELEIFGYDRDKSKSIREPRRVSFLLTKIFFSLTFAYRQCPFSKHLFLSYDFLGIMYNFLKLTQIMKSMLHIDFILVNNSNLEGILKIFFLTKPRRKSVFFFFFFDGQMKFEKCVLNYKKYIK